MSDPGKVIAAFSEDQVERLTDISQRQLRYWDRTGLFRPSLAYENRREAYSRIYSFKDVAALKVVAQLLNFGVSVQHLREVSERLRHLGDDRWTTTQLYVLKKKVVFVDPHENKPREVVSGQWVMPIALKAVWDDTKAAVAKLYERSDDQKGRVTRDRSIAHNAPVIAGTRIRVSAIKNFHAAGYGVDQIIKEYPDLTREDVEAALQYEEKRAAA
jgi:uncharacterized protein (DUF433 family)